ncbi:uncharacterized protein BO66DRAFT_431602 [Aspergillus aculeatinus CBS 121060]|uniref:Uncharacterized protein n=1 Tax=Aspergillus aculeatinus CBS 121060 TaxID=1448322 RepID=A0ACD1GXB9_9EURO|nr:hypothetical protein BO66DRAFT_431602 [Aspergillus aculeatinus CBS 121060]RAH65967.1 hypothetical protein BO66DRAFT_431602 [Aspergillus aculeatinus CBS 121060]
MSGPPEGVVWFPKKLFSVWWDSKLHISDEDRMKELKREGEDFYKFLWVDITVNAKVEDKDKPKKKHPRTEFAVGGATASYDKISALYGRDASNPTRIVTLHQDGNLFAQPEQAYLVHFPMPTPEERFLWLDLTYAIRGVYLPQCWNCPWPYEDLVQLIRLDFKHRSVQIPFAIPYSSKLYPQPERDLLPEQIDRAGLEIMPEKTIVDNVLHPILQTTTRFTKKILGEKATNSDGEPSHEALFQGSDAETKRAKEDLRKWLDSCKGKGPQDQLAKARDLDALAKKYNVDRNPKYYRAEVDQEDLSKSPSGKFQESLKKWMLDFWAENRPHLFGNQKHAASAALVAEKWSQEIAEKPEFKNLTVQSLLAQRDTGERERLVKALSDAVNAGPTGWKVIPKPKLGPVDSFGAAITEMGAFLKLDFGDVFEFNLGKWVLKMADWNQFDDELFGLPKYTPWPWYQRRALLSSPGGQPDSIVTGHIDFTTNPTFGLGLGHADVTLRLDVTELMCILPMPGEVYTRQGEEEVGYQNVSAKGEKGRPIDFYSRDLVLAFPAREVKTSSATKDMTPDHGVITYNGKTFPDIIKREYGLVMNYNITESTPWEKQLALFMVQILAVAADAIPVVGPLVSFTIYMGGNSIIDAAWISQYENSSPPVFALLYSQRSNVAKYKTKVAPKFNFKLTL